MSDTLKRDALDYHRYPTPGKISVTPKGEMHGDVALSKDLLDQVFPDSVLTRAANLLVMPTLDAANITFNVLKATSGHGITVGPIPQDRPISRPAKAEGLC